MSNLPCVFIHAINNFLGYFYTIIYTQFEEMQIL